MKWIPKNPNNICLVGEAPGEQEIKQGIPFVGPEGRYLTKLLEVAGIKKADCFITNVAHEKPRKNVFETLPAQVIADGKRQLKEDIERWQPNVVIACGANALEALALQGSIYRYRGAVMESTMVPGQKMIATLHPGALIKGQPKYEPIVIADLAKANEESSSPDIHYPRRDIDIIRDIKDAVATLEFYTSYPYKLACDIESIGTSGIMTAFGIADSKDHAISITKECLESPQVLRALSKFCDSSSPKIYHNALFDALHNGIYYNIYNRNIVDDTMIKQHAIMPILEKSLGFCASIYTNEVYWKDEGKDFFTELKKNRNGDWDRLYRYNGMDCCLTYEINEAQEEQLDYWGTRDIYEMMKRLIYPCLRAMYTGFRVDHKKVDAFKVENEKAIENLFKIADKTLGGINVRSTPQKKQLLYEEWKLPKQYNKGKVSTSRQCIEKLERFPTPYKAHLGLMRNMSDYLKRRDFYRLNLDKDGRIRYSLKITGTYTGRMASSKSITGSGCMPLEAEAYTPDGWKKISEKPSKILQYNEGRLEFVNVDWYIKDYDGILYGYNGRCFRGLFTPGHRIIFERRNKLYERTADKASEITYANVPVSGYFGKGKDVDEFWIRKYVLLSAEGSLERGKWRIRVKKKKKADRICYLLGRDLPKKDKREYYNFNGIENENFQKEFNEVETWSLKARRIFLDELKYWDGHIRGKSYLYFTTIPKNAYTVQTIAHISGLSASISIDEDNSNRYGNTSTKSLYVVNVSCKTKNGLEKKRWFTKNYKGKVGCPQTLSSMWLVRYDGGIHVTGNSNFQNQPKKVRSFYPAEPGNIFIQMDLSQAEARVVAALCKDEKWLKEFDEEDLHTKVASMLYGIPPEKVRKAVERQTAKRVAHASHYLLGWSLLSNILKCSAKEAKAHKKTYYEIRPKLDDWHGRVRKQIRDTKKIVTPFGRMIQFPGPINDKVIRDAVASEPQSTSADYLNRAINKMYYEGPEEFQFNLQVHDSILFQVPNELSCIQRNIEALKEITEIEIDVHGVPLVIPCDFEIGFDWFNLTELKDISPKSVEKVYEEVCNIQTS